MAITGSTLTYGSDGTDTTTYKPASFSYAGHNLILAAVANGTTGAGGLDVPTLSGTLNWVFVGTISYDTIGSPTAVVSLFRAMSSSSGTESLTISFGRNQSNCLWTIAEFAGVDESGTDGSGAVVQSKTGHIDSNKGYSITFTNPISDSANASVGAFANNMSGAGAVTAPAGYGSTPPVQYSSTPNISLLLDWQVPGLQTVSVAGSNSSHLGGVVAEIKAATTTLGNGSDPGGASLAPGDAATMIDAFTFQTNFGTDTISAVKVTLATGTYVGVGLVEITDPTGSTVYGSISPAGDTVNVPLTTNITATTSISAYKIRITPKSHPNMPIPPGATYNVTAQVSDWTDANNHAGSDSGGTTVTIDNKSPANVTAATSAPEDRQVTLNWTNPSDGDLGSIVVLRKQGGAVGDVPVEGASYTVGNAVGSGGSSVACVVSSTNNSCTDNNGLTNNVTYYYKIFTRDTSGNYSANGVTPGPGSSGSATPQRYQPDVSIKIANSSDTYATDGTYEATATTQSKSQGVPTGSIASYNLKFKNDGSTTDSFTVTGSTGAGSGFTVQYFDRPDDSGTDRTTAVTGAGYTIASLASGAYQEWTLKVTPGTGPPPVAGGTSFPVSVTATSNTLSTKTDQVKAVTTSSSANITLLKSSDKSLYQPGEDILYTTVASNGPSLTSAKNVMIVDPIPANTGFKIGGATFAAGTSTLTGTVSYSNGSYGYIPVSGGCGAPAGYDYCVTEVKWTMTESVPPGMPTGTSFSVYLVVRVK